jgi:hypothetical protein
MYEEYIKGVEKDSPYDISYAQFRDICVKYYKRLMDHLFEGDLYIMPYRLGELYITGKRPKNFNKKTLPVDWAQTTKLGKIVNHFNDHSNYYKYRFTWSKKNHNFKNKTKYRMVFTRANKRRLASIIKSGDYNFFES